MIERITIDEVLTELARLQQPEGPDGFTRRDVQGRYDLNETSASQRIRAWHAKGLIELAGFTFGTSVDGKRYRVPVYRLKQ